MSISNIKPRQALAEEFGESIGEHYMTPVEKEQSPRRYDRLNIEDSDAVVDTQNHIDYLLNHPDQ